MVASEAWLPSAGGLQRRRYHGYLPDPLSDWAPEPDAALQAAIDAADQHCARIGRMGGAPLGVAVASWVVARDESIQSSIIEGIRTSRDALAWAQYRERTGQPIFDANSALTLGAGRQLEAARELGERMREGEACRVEDLRALHAALCENTPDRHIAGVVRHEPIWIGPPNCRIEDAAFVAPPPSYVPDLLEDLTHYINSARHSPAFQAAAAHAQFEAIHPFEDGNGRTGRALIHAVLIARGVVNGAVPISSTLERERREYYAALNESHVLCAPGDSRARLSGLSRWLLLFRDAAAEAEEHVRHALESAEALISQWRNRARLRAGSGATALLEALPSMPILTADMAARRLGMSPKSARTAIRTLTRAGILKPIGGKRNGRYTVPDVIELIPTTTPEGGAVAANYSTAAAAASSLLDALPPNAAARQHIVCAYLGPRSKKPCLLPKGHGGQHRYTTR